MREESVRIQDRGDPEPNVVARLQVHPQRDPRRYNVPTASELAVIIQDTTNSGAPRDILLELKSGFFKRIADTSPAYQPLAYPVLFPYGESGWHQNIPISGVNHTGALDDNEEHDDHDDNGESTSKRKTVSLLEYYAYRLHARPPEIESQHLFNARQLFQQWIVDAWATTDQARLRWLRCNQNAL